ncbi:nucleotidyltransferase [Paenibacillus sp. UMB4589-SE434]|uniref:nucleotidyltransferase n=1 Tax=Paenibacillus sp. UMB4589-SE434 TaxID=3046314 RepID=UPI00254F310E|nr:nucleotidyltransferase [Paenibacillus sp. UMB4589-SE434]MDK8180781.1 nucleotidyltransferase [Paenibacillus sp. UMB4589-SE434]
MRTVGIIVEYNPMHNGHVYHLQQSKIVAGADASIAVMSGHFLQRGEPALLDKWARADMALAQGVDLVLELPVAYAVQPAEWFAHGAVATLHATGVVDALCFGSEIGNIAAISEAARQLTCETTQFTQRLQAALKKGFSYPSAYAYAAQDSQQAAHITPEEQTHKSNFASHLQAVHKDDFTLAASAEGWLNKPNNSLGLHYVMALQRLGSSIEAYTITRQEAGYHDVEVNDSPIASATAIRRLLFGSTDAPLISATKQNTPISGYVPTSTVRILQDERSRERLPMNWEQFAHLLFYKLSVDSREQLTNILEVTEGLEYRLLQTLSTLEAPSVELLLQALKTKRYTRTKLQRMLTHILLGHTKEAFGPPALASGPAYIRVLGFNARGQALLKRMKKTAALPVIHQMTRENSGLGGPCGLAADAQATAVYAAASPQWNGRAARRDFYEPPRRTP